MNWRIIDQVLILPFEFRLLGFLDSLVLMLHFIIGLLNLLLPLHEDLIALLLHLPLEEKVLVLLEHEELVASFLKFCLLCLL